MIYDLQDSSEMSRLNLDFDVFLKKSGTTALPLVLDSDAILFNQVGKLVRNFNSWIENRE